MRFFHARRHRIALNAEQADLSRLITQHLEEQAEEVSALAAYARRQREMNHLTELFLTTRRRST